MEPSEATEPEVRHLPERLRYEIWVDGVRAGMTSYELDSGAVAFMHTRIGDQFEGRGLGSALISTALDDVRSSGGSVLPYCPFVRAFIQRHHEYAGLVPAPRLGEFGLPPAS